MDPNDQEASRRAVLGMVGLGALLTLGFLGVWIFLDRDVDPLYRQGVGDTRSGTIQESYSSDAVRKNRGAAVEMKPLPPPEGMKPAAPAGSPSTQPSGTVSDP